ncbi:MAG: hypothetical protein ACLRHD_06565 [Thomasclavelia spiroformis]
MKSTYDETIFKEDMEMLLLTLTKRTTSKKQIWNCKKYVPITFIDTSEVSEERAKADIFHTFYSETLLNSRLFNLELTELISLPSGKGDIMGSIRYENEFGPHLYEFRLSEDIKFDDCTAGNLILRYNNSPLLSFRRAAVKVFAKSETVKNSPSSDFVLMKKEIDFWKSSSNGPIMQLLEGLMIERNSLRFHQIIFNTSYRTKLYSQYNQLIR